MKKVLACFIYRKTVLAFRVEFGSFCEYQSTDYVSLRKTKEIKDRKQNNSMLGNFSFKLGQT